MLDLSDGIGPCPAAREAPFVFLDRSCVHAVCAWILAMLFALTWVFFLFGQGRKVQIPRRKRLEASSALPPVHPMHGSLTGFSGSAMFSCMVTKEHNFTQCDLLKSADASRSTSCDEHRAFTDSCSKFCNVCRRLVGVCVTHAELVHVFVDKDAARHHGADELQAANVDGLAG